MNVIQLFPPKDPDTVEVTYDVKIELNADGIVIGYFIPTVCFECIASDLEEIAADIRAKIADGQLPSRGFDENS